MVVSFNEQYKDCLEYIDNYWNKITFKPSKIKLKYKFISVPTFLNDLKGNPHTIFVPHTYFVPNLGAQKRICYWDSFFMFKGLIGTRRQSLMKKMVKNFLYLYNKYRIIPNFNAPASINRSQPPFLTSMIIDAYLTPLTTHKQQKYYFGIPGQMHKITYKNSLRSAINIAKNEYETVWIDKKNLYNHHVEGFGLSRYGDRDIGYAHSSELESGWDMTSRFYNRADQFLPIDLNTYLYKYELDFAYVSKILGDLKEQERWNKKAAKRQAEINKLMWDDKEKFFFDYGYKYGQVSQFLSLASYTPLWAGLATDQQAKQMVKKLPLFETPYGLTISTKDSLAKPIDMKQIQRRYYPAIEDIIKPKQWDYPNIWSPLEYLTVIGLLRYGYVKEAKRVMEKSVKAHAKAFRTHNTFFEKLDGETGGSGKGALYGDQIGFGWTNAVFYRYIKILDALASDESIYTAPIVQAAPYKLSILH